MRETKTLPVSLSYTFLPLSLFLPDASLSDLSLRSPSQVFPVLLHYIHNPSHLHTHAQCRVRMPRNVCISRRSTDFYPLSLSPVSLFLLSLFALCLSLPYVSFPCVSLFASLPAYFAVNLPSHPFFLLHVSLPPFSLVCLPFLYRLYHYGKWYSDISGSSNLNLSQVQMPHELLNSAEEQKGKFALYTLKCTCFAFSKIALFGWLLTNCFSNELLGIDYQ